MSAVRFIPINSLVGNYRFQTKLSSALSLPDILADVFGGLKINQSTYCSDEVTDKLKDLLLKVLSLLTSKRVEAGYPYVVKNGHTHTEQQTFKCRDCVRQFVITPRHQPTSE